MKLVIASALNDTNVSLKKKDTLSVLIHSLSANEKRYFQLLFGKSDKDKNYLKVFNAIEKNPEITNDGLKKALKNDKLNVSYEKAYLQKNILKALRQFYEGSSDTLIVGQVLADIEHLFNKGLFDEVLDLIDDQSTWAETNEQYGFLYEMLKWRRRVYMRNTKYAELNLIYKELFRKEKECLERMETSSVYRYLITAVTVTAAKGLLDSKQREAEFKEILSHPYLTDISKAQGYVEISLFHECHALSYQYMLMLEEAYQSQKQLVAHIENHPEKIRSDLYSYIVALFMLANKATSTERYAESLAVIAKVEALAASKEYSLPKSRQRWVYCLVIEYKITALLSAGHSDKVVKLYESEKKGLKDHKDSMSRRSYDLVYLCISVAYFNLSQYEEALTTIRTVIDAESDQNHTNSSTLHINILHLMIHYELGHHDLLPYLLRSFIRFCKINDLSNTFVLRFTELMQQLTKGKQLPREIFTKYAVIFEELNPKKGKADKMGTTNLTPVGINEWISKNAKK